MSDNVPDLKEQQLALAEGLQLKWLKRMDQMFDDGTITSTDMATLVRFLSANGWTLDPSRLPKGLRGKLTEKHSATEFDEEEETGKVININNRR